MLALYKKEISSFFSSLTGIVVVSIFLVINGLFVWVIPSENNVLESGYANIDGLFNLAPWVFLFLAPAVSMRMFSEEKSNGTLDLLLTRPLSELQIVLAKYLASVTLVIFSILPTLIYFISVYNLSQPQGNIDTGAIWGSYIGLFFLASIYVAIGIFCSAVTENQIIAFLMSALLSFILYIGFDILGSFSSLSAINTLILSVGIEEHYKSISRGVIDSRDIVYYLGVITIFISLTRLILLSKKW
jgi:ABC-2 type transport system permease protein